MSRAFTRDGQEGEGAEVLPDRPLSPHRNLVTRRGLGRIEAALQGARSAFAQAERAGERGAMGHAARDIRYWQARRAGAELVEPGPDDGEVRFGMAVTLRYPDGRSRRWRIVGEDEADAGEGRISHVAPLARALYGKGVGDAVTIGAGEAEIEAIDAVPEAP
ncbi:transcription elongation factor GreA [Labrys wisconsinensis]|uniref:Transcription elongation GreA/GreB family factor n=1 Tax=Labrys wisconsinensis TaxID=425677 RepID=A0ABU0J659_9HYPH|nr:transcription elongation factor GreA [Labrys wisconsinensis]MDQ0469751.1 transcription elongation GreA/GreB family factor [Labrys wisconsinensis]